MAEHVFAPRLERRVVNWLVSDHAAGITLPLVTALRAVTLAIEGEGVERPGLTLCRGDGDRVAGVLVSWVVGPRQLRLAITGWRCRKVRRSVCFYPILSWVGEQRIGRQYHHATDGESSGPGWIEKVREIVDWVHGGAAVASLGGLGGVETRGW